VAVEHQLRITDKRSMQADKEREGKGTKEKEDEQMT